MGIVGDRHRVRPVVVDQIDAYDRSTGRDWRKLASGPEANGRPLCRILHGRRWCISGAVADEMERFHPGSSHDDVETWRTPAAVPAVAVVETENEGGSDPHPANALDFRA